jgi:hypothetical protein
MGDHFNKKRGIPIEVVPAGMSLYNEEAKI